MFLQELKNFSKQNWWIYLLLIVALTIVWITWKWNIIEILVLFLLNFLWNLFIMVMQKNYSSWNNKIWAIYHLSSTITFTLISIYWLFAFNQYQYIIWQICYWIAAVKAFTFYNLKKDIKFFNEYFVWILNTFLIIFFIFLWKKFWINIDLWSVLMAFWFSFITTWLVSIVDKFRYWTNLIWIIFIILGSSFWVFNWYLKWNINWVSLWYMILTLTTFVYYIKLLKFYLNKKWTI